MKILAVHSPSTKGATERIKKICDPGVEVDFMTTRPEDMSGYDGVLVHNSSDVREGEIWYPCGMPMARMVNLPEYREEMIAKKPRAIWTNSYTSEDALLKLVPPSIEVKCMQKPFKLDIPNGPLPRTTKKRVLWYWKPDWQYTTPVNEQIFEAMRELKDYEIFQISNKGAGYMPPGPGLGHVKPYGRLDLVKALKDCQGMVRATDGLDFGRSTFQVMACGRWCIYVGFQEPNVIGAKSFKRIPELVRMMYSGWSDTAAYRAHKYVSERFTEEGLNKTWVKEFQRLFRG